MPQEKRIKVGITLGEPTGIGPEIILKALYRRSFLDLQRYEFHVFAPFDFLSEEFKKTDFFSSDKQSHLQQACSCYKSSLSDTHAHTPAHPTQNSGYLAYLSIKQATLALKEKAIDVLVTAPIDKSNMLFDAFSFMGHTEYFSDYFKTDALMFMVSDDLKVAVCSGHVPLKEAHNYINKAHIEQKLSQLKESLRQDFGKHMPKIAILGFNPHAGDKGKIGIEDQRTLMPIVNAHSEYVCGPFGADGFFGLQQYKHYDAVLAMYHDQGLIPFKTLRFDVGVNFTAGLPVVRTSPAHGVAYDIAGKQMASSSSFLTAIHKAVDIFTYRKSSFQN